MMTLKDAEKLANEKGYKEEYPESYAWGILRAKLEILYLRMNDYKKVEYLRSGIHSLFDDVMEEG